MVYLEEAIQLSIYFPDYLAEVLILFAEFVLIDINNKQWAFFVIGDPFIVVFVQFL